MRNWNQFFRLRMLSKPIHCSLCGMTRSNEEILILLLNLLRMSLKVEIDFPNIQSLIFFQGPSRSVDKNISILNLMWLWPNLSIKKWNFMYPLKIWKWLKPLLPRFLESTPAELQQQWNDSEVVLVEKKHGIFPLGSFPHVKWKFWSVGSCIAAVAATKTGRPVRLLLGRDEDMKWSGHRHPFMGKYRVGFTNEGVIQALDIQLYNNGGLFHQEINLVLISFKVIPMIFPDRFWIEQCFILIMRIGSLTSEFLDVLQKQTQFQTPHFVVLEVNHHSLLCWCV